MMRSIARVMIAVAAGVWVLSSALLAAPTAAPAPDPVKRGAELLKANDNKGAIVLLSGVLKDYDFCSAKPADAAKAGMLLCDAYEATGQQGSDAYKLASGSVKASLIQVWASLKKANPELSKRLDKMGEVCVGHPQALGEFIKTVMPKILTSAAKTDFVGSMDAFFSVYDTTLSAAPKDKQAPDKTLLVDMTTSIINAPVAPGTYDQISGLVKRMYSRYGESIAATQEDKALVLIIIKDYPGGVDLVKRIFAAKPNAEPTRVMMALMAAWLTGAGDKEHLVDVYRASLVDGVDKNYRLAITVGIGDLLFELKRYAEASAAYSEVATMKSGQSEFEAKAMLKTALCSKELGDDRLAEKQLADVVKTYPDTLTAKQAIKQQYIYGWYKDDSEDSQ